MVSSVGIKQCDHSRFSTSSFMCVNCIVLLPPGVNPIAVNNNNNDNNNNNLVTELPRLPKYVRSFCTLLYLAAS
jgi:hypothetical protein